MKYFIADLHLGDKYLFGDKRYYFKCMDQYREEILASLQLKLTNRDILFILGDIARSDLMSWRNKLPRCQLWLIPGNHDPTYKKCKEVFGKNIRSTIEVKIESKELNLKAKCFLSHYAHAFWPSSHYGSYHLYGHTHGSREHTLDEWMPQRRSLDVSPDNLLRQLDMLGPISEHEVLEHLSVRTGHDQVSFYRERDKILAIDPKALY